LRNDSGPALLADSLKVAQIMLWRDGFTATGAGDFGAINLTGAHIGMPNGTAVSLRNNIDPALKADSRSRPEQSLLRASMEEGHGWRDYGDSHVG
jgi:hypothetical protein